MTVKVKFFAKLREDLGLDQTDAEIESAVTVKDIWSITTRRPLPDDIFCAINHDHARLDQTVNDGDEVAFFPRITGG